MKCAARLTLILSLGRMHYNKINNKNNTNNSSYIYFIIFKKVTENFLCTHSIFHDALVFSNTLVKSRI